MNEKQKKEFEFKQINKILKRTGFRKSKRNIIRHRPEEMVYSREVYKSVETSGYVGKKLEDSKYIQEVSSKYVIGQAYNKSGFQVLTKKENKDSSTGKRR